MKVHPIRTLAVSGVAGLVLSTAPHAAAQPDAPTITQAVFFGDSLTDAGTYGFRFTTNPGRTWAQHIAIDLGQPETPNEHVADYDDVFVGKPGLVGPGGLNYAQGGARAGLPYSVVSDSLEGTPISTEVQLQRFLSQHGEFTPNQLVALWVGTNDVALNFDSRFDEALAADLRADRGPTPEKMVADRARVQDAAAAEARTVSAILDHGGQHVLVFRLFDLGLLPWFETQAARDYVNALTAVYNSALICQLPDDPRVQMLDTNAFVNDLLANPDVYGFTHGANDDACALPAQDYCDAQSLKEPGADRTYVFGAAEHLTTHAHELLADYVQREVGLRPSGS